MDEIHPTLGDYAVVRTPNEYFGKALQHPPVKVRAMSFLYNLRPIKTKVVSLNAVMPQIAEQLLLDPRLDRRPQAFDFVRQRHSHLPKQLTIDYLAPRCIVREFPTSRQNRLFFLATNTGPMVLARARPRALAAQSARESIAQSGDCHGILWDDVRPGPGAQTEFGPHRTGALPPLHNLTTALTAR
jgi:hypothetical protein